MSTGIRVAAAILCVTAVARGGPVRSGRTAAAAEEGAGQDTRARHVVLDLGGGVSMQLARIPAGTFIMGSPPVSPLNDRLRRTRDEQPRHQVAISRAFCMGVCEVTRGQFAAFVKDSGYRTDAEKNGWAFAWDGRKWAKVRGASWRSVGFEQTDEHPVLCVSWDDAAAFCGWLGRESGRTVRLPAEAEWEYACRAGSTAAYCWGDDPAGGDGWCNGADRTGKKAFRGWNAFRWADGYVYTAPVGRFKTNGFGLHDMHGNVWEWCADRPGSGDGKGEGGLRVIRGGSWLSSPGRCRSAFRVLVPALGGCCDQIIGFRVAAETAPAEEGADR